MPRSARPHAARDDRQDASRSRECTDTERTHVLLSPTCIISTHAEEKQLRTATGPARNATRHTLRLTDMHTFSPRTLWGVRARTAAPTWLSMSNRKRRHPKPNRLLRVRCLGAQMSRSTRRVRVARCAARHQHTAPGAPARTRAHGGRGAAAAAAAQHTPESALIAIASGEKAEPADVSNGLDASGPEIVG